MLVDMDWLFSADEYICDLRTVGVLIKNNKILVQRERNGNEFALPGGHIKIGETLEDGLIREYREETGADIKIKRLLWSEECFWKYEGKQVHGMAFYFLINECDGLEIPDNNQFVPHKDNSNVVIGWIDIDEIKNVTIYPKFLKTEIYDLNGEIKHFVSEG